MINNTGIEKREAVTSIINSDLVVVGGGLAGVCAAIAAAREGIKVTLVQDRPVLGGNASSEIRLWILGATSHMGNNNRWAREGGIMDEILVENTYKNPEGNPVIFDTILMDKVFQEKNITLLLNTVVYSVGKKGDDLIESLEAFCSQNQVKYILSSPLFIDASGDGIVGFLSGAAFRMGAESMEEFGEKFAPTKEYGELLGHSLYFYTKDTGRPVAFHPPSYALKDIKDIPRYRSFNTKEYGCRLWWIEYGGRLDTVTDTEKIKWELWKIVYGVWDYIKNSGEFPEAENLTLEWVGTIPGKRESRRFEGDYMLRQQDIVEQRTHYDAVSYGGWSIDLHPADGVFSDKPGCNQWHSKGIYQIPYRCLYSRNIKNLFLAGRIISATHVAFGSSRVMATGGAVGQAVGTAASICTKKNLYPRDISEEIQVSELQQTLLKEGHFIPGFESHELNDLLNTATIAASSELLLQELPLSNIVKPLVSSTAQMIPLKQGKVPEFIFHADGNEETKLIIELRVSKKINNFTPEEVLSRIEYEIKKGRNCMHLDFSAVMPEDGYAFICFLKNPAINLYYSEQRITGVLSVFNQINPAVSNYGKQTPLLDIGVDDFEFWCPKRRPDGQNVAIKIANGINAFSAENIRNGIDRPTTTCNAWVADISDKQPSLQMIWDKTVSIKTISLSFDTDFDHPMETVLMGHPENVMPFCVRNYALFDKNGRKIFEKKGNYQSRNKIVFDEPIETDFIEIRCEHPNPNTPAAIFAIRCYEN